MASTYSNLKFELIGTGDQSGTWGTTTNTNLGTAIEQAIVGMATISSGFVTNSLTLTLTDTNAAQNARALVLNLTQALSGAGTLNVPAIQKPYMIINATGQTVTVKVTGLTGVAVPNGTRAFLYNNGTDVGDFFNYASSLTLGTDLAVADGGTGASSAPVARTNLGATTVGSNLFTLTNPSAITFLRINADNTVSALDAATFRTAIGAGTGGGSVSSVSGTGTVQGLSLSGTVTTTGSLTLGGSLSAVSLTTQVSGTLPVANGGTGIATTTAYGVLTGGTTATGNFQNAGTGTSGQVLTSNGPAALPTWQAAGGGANIQSFPASGTYTKPPGAKFVQVELWGAGGGGGKLGFFYVGCCPYPTSGGGGGGGAYSYRMFAAPEVGATETVTIGAGGTGATVPANATNGGATTFGSLLFAGGGKLGLNGNAQGQQAGGGIAVNFPSPGTIQALPTPFSGSIAFYGTSCNAPIMAIWGGGPGGSIISPFGYPPSYCSTSVRRAISGYGSAFGGGGGGSGCVSGVFYSTGGTGRLLGTNTFQNAPFTYVSNVVTGGGGYCGAGNSFNGGGGGGFASPSYAGKNGGIVGGGGGGGRAPSTPASVGGNGGNGYAIVYTW